MLKYLQSYLVVIVTAGFLLWLFRQPPLQPVTLRSGATESIGICSQGDFIRGDR